MRGVIYDYDGGQAEGWFRQVINSLLGGIFWDNHFYFSEDVQKVIDWVKTQDDAGNFPDIGGKVVSIECMPSVPQIRYADEAENRICYFITVRIRYVNPYAQKAIEYDADD